MASVQSSDIFLLSLAYQSFFDEMYSSLIDSIRNSFQMKRAKTAKGAIQYLLMNSPKAILVTDEGLAKAEHVPVLDLVVSYVRNGGLMIAGFHFPNFTAMGDFDKFFNEGFGLPWKYGDYHRTNFGFNHSCSLPATVVSNSFPPPYSMKAVHIKNAEPHEKIFVPITGAKTQSLVFPPEEVDQTQAAVVGTKVGDGFIVYIGDVNSEKESFDITRRLCGI